MADQPPAGQPGCQQPAGPADSAAACDASTTAAVGNASASVTGGMLAAAEAALPTPAAAAHATQLQQPEACVQPLQAPPPAAAEIQPQPCASPTTSRCGRQPAGSEGMQATALATRTAQPVGYCHSRIQQHEARLLLHEISPKRHEFRQYHSYHYTVQQIGQ